MTATETRQRKMVDLNVDETSGVDWPAHLAPGWVVCKSATAEQVESLFGKGATEGTATMAPTAAQETPTVESLAKQLEELTTKLEKAEADKVAAETRATEAEATIAKSAEAELTEEQKILKALPAEMRDRFEKMEADNKATQEKLQKAIDDRLDDQARTEAASMFKNLAVDTNAVGPQLRRLQLTDADLHKSVTEALKAANEQLKTAGIFQTVGKSSGDASAEDQLNVKAAELRAADPNMTKEAAFAKAVTDPANSELVKSYYAEQAGK